MRRRSQQLHTTKKMIKNTGSLAILCLVSHAAHALIVPGSQITNIASGDYTDALGNILVINSNPVSLTVQKVFALTLIEDQKQISTLGAPVTFPHLLTNTGNSPDQYLLNLSQVTSTFALSGLAVYADRNQDGVADDNVNLNGTQVSLNAGESLALVIVGSVPATANIGNQSSISLKATSQQNSALSQLVTDLVTVVDQAVINVTKSQSVSTGTNGTVITYTLAYTNTGTAAGRLMLADLLDSSLSYQANSGTWSSGSALTDADDTEASVNPSNSNINYKLVGTNQIEFAIANIDPLTSGSVSFKVNVKPTASPKISNTASYSQYNGIDPVAVKTTKTNTVVFSLQQQLGVVLNNNPSSSSNNGNPNSAPDNLNIKANVAVGTPVIFDNYVWNTGNTSDSYNLSYSASNLPSCAKVQFVGADGQTPLTDSNGDGIVDTGSLAAGQARAIKVRVTTTPTCSTTNVINIDVVARSIANSSISDPMRNQIDKIIVQGATDLYNANGSGTGVGVVDANGVALLSKPIVAGQSTVFPLVINNSGTSNNNYTLYVSGTAIDLNNPNGVTGLPVGWSVRFFEGDASCSNLTQQIVNSGNIAAGTSKTYCAQVIAPSNATQASLPLWFAILSPINAQGDVVKNQVTLSQLRQFNLTNDQQGQIQIGGTAVYLHTLKNTGAVIEGQNIGDVLLSVQSLSATDGFSYSLYFDANNNGSLDSTDFIVTDLNSIAAGGLSPDQSVQLLIKVQAPSSATNGMASQVKLIVTPTGQVSGLSATSVQNIDTTTVNPNQLRLTKAQVKDALCNSTNFASLTFGTTSVSVKPNQCVVYRLSVRNDGVAKVDDVKIQDTVPAYTSLRTPPGVSVTQGTANTANGQITGNVGSLMPQQEASLYFSILVNP